MKRSILSYLLSVLVISVNEVKSISNAESAEEPEHIYNFPFHNRSSWGAREPRDLIPIALPVSYVVVHDSMEPPSIEMAGCYNFAQCSQSMRNIQNLHMDDNGWWDIGYNFLVGSDGAAYEGRGWEITGAQAKYFNSVSIGICFVGKTATPLQIDAFHNLTAAGVKMGYIRPDYRLVTHGQTRNTTCPGKKLTKRVQAWPHYSSFPGSIQDLLDIPEIAEIVKEEIRKEIAQASGAL